MTNLVYGSKLYKPYAPLAPTPDGTSLDSTRVSIVLPYAPSWIGLWIGAMLTLCEPENFQEFDGGMSRDDTAEIFREALYDALLLPDSEQLPTPYWDDPEGDDAASGEDNPAFPFYEDAAAFAIGGFVLYAAGIGAALQYWTVQQQFRVAVRKHDLGGALKVFLDGTFLGEYDTYSATPELAYVDIVSPGSMLRLEVGENTNPAVVGDPVVQIIRKRLWDGELLPPNTRYNDITDTVEVYDPVSDTWSESPQSDPRLYNQYPPPTLTDGRCTAAARMVALLQELIDTCITALSVGSGLIEIAAIITAAFSPFVGFALFAALVLTIAAALVELGYAVLFAEFEGFPWDTFRCTLIDFIDGDNYITPPSLELFKAQVLPEYTLIQRTTIDYVLSLAGSGGLNDAVATRNEDYDCSDCENSLYFNFLQSPYNFQWFNWTGSGSWQGRTTWSNGVGWIGAQSAAANQRGLALAAFDVPLNSNGYDRFRISWVFPVNSVYNVVVKNHATQATIASHYNNNTGAGTRCFSVVVTAFDADTIDIYIAYNSVTTALATLRSIEFYDSGITPNACA